MQRSAEWLRGAIAGLRHWQNEIISTSAELIEHYTVKLAEAEAREAQQPTAAEVIAACEKALARWKHYIMLVDEGSDIRANLVAYPAAKVQNDETVALIARWKEANGGTA